MNGSRRKKTHVHALHADDLASFLDRVGLAESFDSGALRCEVCGQALHDAGVGAARAEEGQTVFACGHVECVREFS